VHWVKVVIDLANGHPVLGCVCAQHNTSMLGDVWPAKLTIRLGGFHLLAKKGSTPGTWLLCLDGGWGWHQQTEHTCAAKVCEQDGNILRQWFIIGKVIC